MKGFRLQVGKLKGISAYLNAKFCLPFLESSMFVGSMFKSESQKCIRIDGVNCNCQRRNIKFRNFIPRAVVQKQFLEFRD